MDSFLLEDDSAAILWLAPAPLLGAHRPRKIKAQDLFFYELIIPTNKGLLDKPETLTWQSF
jgi:hypothetical protein